MVAALNAFIVLSLVAIVITAILPFANVKHVGGLYHWRMGRVGGSFYLAKARKPKAKREPRLRFSRRAAISHAVVGFGVDAPTIDRSALALRKRMYFAIRSARADMIFA